jgi:SepF-like predicted cell division protein (DUF552 family)
VISGVLMSFVPLGYILSTNVWELVLVKVYDGFVWGAFDLVIFNYLLSVSPAEKRPTFIANHNFVSGAGTVLGALVGAILAYQFASTGFLMLYGLQAVFLLSLLLRLSSTVFLPKIADIETKMCVPVKYVFWETVAIGPAKGIEHAITQALRYPYAEKIKGSLGLKEKKVKMSFKPKAEPDVSEKKQKPKEMSGKEVKGKGVLDMQLLDRQRSPEGGEYMELGIERQSPKTAKIVVHSLQRFTETDKIVKSIKARNVVFVGLRTMKQTNMDDLKQSVAKINRACIDCSSSLSLVDEEWLIVTPQTAALT